jgi:hypothetical protein
MYLQTFFFLLTGDEAISVNPPKEPGAPIISQGTIHILRNYFDRS